MSWLPFEMCGGSSSHGLATVLLIGGTGNIIIASGGSTAGSDGNDSKTKTDPDVVNGGKALNASSPGMLPPPGPTATTDRDYKERKKGDLQDENADEHGSGQNVTTRTHPPTDEGSHDI